MLTQTKGFQNVQRSNPRGRHRLRLRHSFITHRPRQLRRLLRHHQSAAHSALRNIRSSYRHAHLPPSLWATASGAPVVFGQNGVAGQHLRLRLRPVSASIHRATECAICYGRDDELVCTITKDCSRTDADKVDSRAPVIFIGVMAIALTYYFAGGRKTYVGPVRLVKNESDWTR